MSIAHPRSRWPCLIACLVWLAALAAALPAEAQGRRDPATLVQAAELRQSPAAGAPVIATLAAGDAVAVLEMRGEHAKVDAQGRTGWVAAAALRLGEGTGAASGGATSWLRGLTGLLGGGPRRGERQATVSMGVRGLQSEDIANAQPDPAAVQRLDRYRALPEQALAYARGEGLASISVDYRDAGPASAPAAAGTARGAGN
jgi:hypothetical protein